MIYSFNLALHRLLPAFPLRLLVDEQRFYTTGLKSEQYFLRSFPLQHRSIFDLFSPISVPLPFLCLNCLKAFWQYDLGISRNIGSSPFGSENYTPDTTDQPAPQSWGPLYTTTLRSSDPGLGIVKVVQVLATKEIQISLSRAGHLLCTLVSHNQFLQRWP